jgi:hypothetical protein
MVKIVITNTAVPACQETYVKYVQDQQGAPCAFPNQTLPASCPSCLAIPVSNGSNTLDTYNLNFTIPNNGTSPMQLAGRNLRIRWDLPAGDTNHLDLKLTSVVWTVPSGGSGITLNVIPAALLASPGPTVTDVTVPSNVANLPAGQSMVLQIRWQYRKDDDCTFNNCTGSNPPQPALELTVPPLQKLCMDYRISSEPGVTKHCNVVGQAVSTANPTNCD